MTNELEEMMIKDGWVLGYYEHWGVKYRSFRKDGFETGVPSMCEICSFTNEDGKHFKKWRKE